MTVLKKFLNDGTKKVPQWLYEKSSAKMVLKKFHSNGTKRFLNQGSKRCLDQGSLENT